MKKTILIFIFICITCGLSFGQASQSLSFTGPTTWMPNTTFTLNANLTFSGYSAYGVFYWLEVPNAVAPFLSVTGVQYFTFTDPNQLIPNPALFNSTMGARPGYMVETRDFGATAPSLNMPEGSYPITTLTFSLAAGVPLGTYTMYSTSTSPRISTIGESAPNFGTDHNLSAAPFVFTIVPEPSTIALLVLGAVGSGLLVYRRKRRSLGLRRATRPV